MFLDNIMYEPDQFPGAVYRMDDPKVVILIFSSGKLYPGYFLIFMGWESFTQCLA
jgi:hypothetical protein